METQLARGGRIVVGVDRSDSAKAALAWAVRQAGLTGAEVDAVAAWLPLVQFGWAPPYDGPGPREAAEAALDEAIDDVRLEALGVVIRPVVVRENAARALLDAAKDADLLVVGSRGHSGFTEALLGSVGQHCVHHARCPVVVVRTPHD
ncbi:universal stress protein [Trebonia kvetii]|uniref:Universal stress protein n=1 Tax=Trebonia kvetii TaxID=2480626 RepID=A0A6P2C099_9ACTN|nr:universal stress protein [Trebonia kvetii]TVZ04367.1 universal stress protein [Trebonia kvetii]